MMLCQVEAVVAVGGRVVALFCVDRWCCHATCSDSSGMPRRSSASTHASRLTYTHWRLLKVSQHVTDHLLYDCTVMLYIRSMFQQFHTYGMHHMAWYYN